MEIPGQNKAKRDSHVGGTNAMKTGAVITAVLGFTSLLIGLTCLEAQNKTSLGAVVAKSAPDELSDAKKNAQVLSRLTAGATPTHEIVSEIRYMGADNVVPSFARMPADVVQLADSYVAEFVAQFPEQADLYGFPVSHHDRLSDNSLTALHRWQAFEDKLAANLGHLDSLSLQGRPAWITLGFLREAVESGRRLRVCRQELWPVNQIFGWQVTFSQLAELQPVDTKEHQAEALRRWSTLPPYLEVEIKNLREGVRLGYTTPKHNVEIVLTQLDSLLDQAVEQWPFYAPAQNSKAPQFAKAWRHLLVEQIRPAVVHYRNYLRDEYLPAARSDIALRTIPNGEKCYEAMFRRWTSIDRPPVDTYNLGSQQVERNRAQALEIAKKMGFDDLQTLLARMASDPEDHFKSGDELLAFSRDAVTRARERIPKWFNRLPHGDVIIEPYPAFAEEGAAGGILYPPGPGGNPPATFRIPLSRLDETPRSRAERTAYHETYPGHALQLGLEAEIPQLHPIVQLTGTSAFREGWARYAEALAEEMGLYQSKYSTISRRLWPSRGLVLDTGMHIFGWSRERAVAYILESGNMGPEQASALIDRIAITPGQLTAYDTGAAEIFDLREKARRQLGGDFDIREFHDAVLQNGSVTLPMLREQVESWLALKRSNEPRHREKTCREGPHSSATGGESPGDPSPKSCPVLETRVSTRFDPALNLLRALILRASGGCSSSAPLRVRESIS